jgi:hypothetical protein
MKKAGNHRKPARRPDRSLTDCAMEDLLRMAPKVSDEQLSVLLAKYAEEKRQKAKSRRSRASRKTAASE